MNLLLKFLVNGPVWTILLKFVFLPKLKQMLSSEVLVAAKVLELGCGVGESTKIFKTWFQNGLIIATDFDLSQVNEARKRCAAIPGIEFEQADANKLPYENDLFDVVIETNTFHHVKDWRAGIREAARVLKQDGFFVIMDESSQLTAPLIFRIIDRPEAIFDLKDFCAELQINGLRIEVLRGKGIFYIVAKKV